MKLQTLLIVVCLATIAGIILVHQRTRTAIPVGDVVLYAGGSSADEADPGPQARLRTSVFGGSRLSRHEIEYGARRYHELLAQARDAADEAPAAAPERPRKPWMRRGQARPHTKAERPSAWKIGMNKKNSAGVRPSRGWSRAGIYGRSERNASQHRSSVFERSRHYQQRGSVYPLGSHTHSALQRRRYDR